MKTLNRETNISTSETHCTLDKYLLFTFDINEQIEYKTLSYHDINRTNKMINLIGLK